MPVFRGGPGNFTFDETMGKWVMTVFNTYQWDLNYSNPAVFIEIPRHHIVLGQSGRRYRTPGSVAFCGRRSALPARTSVRRI